MALSRGISDTKEWKLIRTLRQNSHKFSYNGRNIFHDHNKRTLKLRTALSDLNIQLHTTFTILQLESFILLEAELEANESHESSQLESDEEMYSASEDLDEDDSSSQSSERLSDTPSNSPHLLYNKAVSLLSGLCSFLEVRVNSTLIEPKHSDHSLGYPRLSRLLGYIDSLPDLTNSLNFIPVPNSGPKSFLFNISKDAAGADAFVAFSNTAQSLPDKETRRQMLAEIRVMRDHIFNFNNFVNGLHISMESLDNLAARSNRTRASAETFASFNLLQKFRQQAAAARRAMFSHFKLCTYSGSAEHNVFLRLPGWEDVSDCRSRESMETQMAQLFFIRCPHNDWQHARMYFLQTMHANACKKLKLCKALRSAYDNKRDLEFYISEDTESPESGEIPIHIPIDPKRGRRYGESFPDDSISLWTLIKQGYFAKEESIDLWLNTDDKGTILGFEQRKALAIRLVLGLMLSIDSDHIIDTWDPKRIHFLKPRDMEFTPFIPIHGNIKNSGPRNRLFLANLDISNETEDEYAEPKRLPPFALLAKALLHIARGERLETLKMSYKSENTFRDACNRLDDVVERYINKVINGNEVDRQVLPFLIAARNCLRFHTQYQLCLNTTGSKHRMEIAWKLVFDEILAKIDSSLVLEKPAQSSIDASVKEEPRFITGHTVASKPSTTIVFDPTETTSVTTAATKSLNEWAAISSIGTITAQPEVALFDGEDTTENSRDTERAREFFKMLDDFHSSYSRFVTDRIATPRRIRIAILDTGIDFQHAGIMQAKEEGRMKEEWCYSWVGDDVRDEDDELHGTNCAFLLHKAAPEAEIYVEKVFQHNSFKVYQAQNIAKAINHAVNTWDVDIISMSFGLTPPAPRLDGNLDAERLALQQFEEIISDIETAIHDASARSPRIMFAAASNNGKNGKRAFPAKYGQGVICVHASDGNGTDLGINPPTDSGVNLMTLGMGLELYRKEWVFRAGRKISEHKKTYKSGTSFATPIAAGIAATVLDLANRVKDITDRAREKLKRAEHMEKMFLKLLSSPNHSSGDHYSFLAPWHLWETHWEANLSKSKLAWGKINDLFAV